MADQQILTEPVMRNTAPCVAYGCFKIESMNPMPQLLWPLRSPDIG
jgi:mannose-1-phosphate guanylyltransferase